MLTLGFYGAYLAALVGVVALVPRVRRLDPDRATRIAGAVLPAVAGLVLLLTDCPWFGDFDSAYYPAGQATLSASLSYATDCVSGFVNIPLVAALFAPFAWFSYPVAVGLFTLLGLAAIAWTFVLLRRICEATRLESLMIASLMALAGPLWYSVREGNTTHLVFPLLLTTWLQRHRRPAVAGVCLATAAVIKLPLVVMGAYFLWRRQWSAITAAIVTGVCIGGLSLLVFGRELHESWMASCIIQPSGQPIPAFNVQSIDGLLARLSGGSLLSWTPMQTGAGFRATRTLIIGALAAWVCSALWRHGPGVTRRADLLEFSAVLVFTIVVFPVSWTHYYLLLLMPLAVLFVTHTVPRPPWQQVAIVAAAAGVLLPLRTPPTAPGSPLHLLLSIVPSSLTLIGGLMLLWLLLREHAREGHEIGVEIGRPSLGGGD